MKIIHTSGTRKRAIARATFRPGKGVVRVNSVLLENIQNELIREKVTEPVFLGAAAIKKVNISIKVHGGGVIGQAEAARTAVARGLVQVDKTLHKTFMDYDRTLLVTDVRLKETHKPNRHGKARAKVQKSYR